MCEARQLHSEIRYVVYIRNVLVVCSASNLCSAINMNMFLFTSKYQAEGRCILVGLIMLYT